VNVYQEEFSVRFGFIVALYICLYSDNFDAHHMLRERRETAAAERARF